MDPDQIQRAAARLRGVSHRTPVITSRTLDERVRASVYLKAEGLQRAGAFKFRGAYNAVSSLDPSALRRGVCTASSGNHAQALALAARLCGTSAVILMPQDAPAFKRAATEGYGAEVLTFDRYRDDREHLMGELAAQRGLALVHPYDDPLVIAGAGTTALELVEQAGEIDLLLVPVGGGGLIAGCATAVKSLLAPVRVIGVEPQAGDDVARSKAAGHRVRIAVMPTIADGQQASTPGALTWPIISELVDDVVTVSDSEIVVAMRLLFERLKVIAEPSGACALAALLAGKLDTSGQRIGVVLSGANIDARRFGELIAGG